MYLNRHHYYHAKSCSYYLDYRDKSYHSSSPSSKNSFYTQQKVYIFVEPSHSGIKMDGNVNSLKEKSNMFIWKSAQYTCCFILQNFMCRNATRLMISSASFWIPYTLDELNVSKRVLLLHLRWKMCMYICMYVRKMRWIVVQ